MILTNVVHVDYRPVVRFSLFQMFTRLYATTATSGLRSLSTKGPISSFMWVCSQDHEWQFSSLHLTISSDPAFSLRTDQGRRRSQACEHLNLFNHAISSSFRRCRVPARASSYQGLLFSLPKMCLEPHVALSEYSWYRFFTET